MDFSLRQHGGRVFIWRNETEDPPYTFKCELDKMRCSGTTKTGAQCRRNTVKYLDKCFQHLKSEMGLVVKPSTIPGAGDGLFTTRDRKVGEKIIQYHGEIMDQQEIDERYQATEPVTAPYVVEEKKNRFIDAACNRGTAAFVNHKAIAQSNCRWLVSRAPNPAVWVVARKNIKATTGNPTELFISYGQQYQMNEPGITFRTTR